MATSNPTQLDFATIFKDENDIIIITMKDCGRLDHYDMININLAIRHKTQKKPVYKLFDARANWSMNKKAKEYAKAEDSPERTKARAIVVSNIVKSTLLRFMESFSRKEYPQEFFTDWNEAHSWLLKLKEAEYVSY